MKKAKKSRTAIKSIAKDITKSAKSAPGCGERLGLKGKLLPIMLDLIKVREAAGMNRVTLAKRMGKSLSQITGMENGSIRAPSVPILMAYADALGFVLVIELWNGKFKKDINEIVKSNEKRDTHRGKANASRK